MFKQPIVNAINMKYLFTLLIISTSFLAQSQDKRTGFSTFFVTGTGEITRFFKQPLGGGTTDGNSLNSIGLNYFTETARNFFLETGIQYLKYNYTQTPAFTGSHTPSPASNTLHLISIPVKVRYEFAKLFFLNGGLYTDMEVGNRQKTYTFSGIGAGIGAGVQYYFTNKIGIYANPQLGLRNLLSFSTQNQKASLLDASISFGLAYRLK